MESETIVTTIFQEEINEDIQELEDVQEFEEEEIIVEEAIVEEVTVVECVSEVIEENLITEDTEVTTVVTEETEAVATTVTTIKYIDYTSYLQEINNNIVCTNLFLFLITVTMFIVILYTWLKSLFHI